ncbi:MAG: transglycosylase domain-containing protein, partial [Candidatus Eremiobacteraeota bacterium]|nr:transglycosylase domain-containing protein [Candidatus Eremiobacteraeota bacterium]
MKKGRTRFLSRRISFFRIFFTVVLLSLLMFGVGAAWTAHTVKKDLEATLPSVEKLEQTEGRKITRILSSDGQLIATLFKENYKPVTHDELGENIVNAVVAIEDRRFFEHDGVDYRGVARAAVGNALAGEIEQGASTITMQLARHLYLSDERSYERKIREALLARKIEQEFPKQAILTRYLNEVYFGSGANGIGAAASRYYGTTPDKLTVSQAALLAGLIQSPTYLNPLTNHQGARHRQVQVLTAMRDQNYISSEQYRKAIFEATHEDFRRASSGQPMLKYPYFSSYVASQLVEEQGEEAVYSGGLTVQTTLQRDVQTKVQNVLRDVIQK